MTARKSRRRATVPRLGPLEEALLAHLWDVGESDIKSAHAETRAARGVTENTVGSALERLFKKGLVTRRKVSRAYRYRPSADSYVQRMSETVGGPGALASRGLLAAFVDLVAKTDEGALDELEALIDTHRGKTS